MNLRNGTFVINGNDCRIRSFDQRDFLTYQLPFDFDEAADCPLWRWFLDEVLPERSKQDILAEFVGYVFARH